MTQARQDIWRQIGMMMDDLGFYERLSGFDNLKLCAGLHGVRTEKIGEILKQVGLYQDRKCPGTENVQGDEREACSGKSGAASSGISVS